MTHPEESRGEAQAERQTSGATDHAKRTADWTRALTAVTAALVAVGVLQFGASLFQWSAMREQLEDSRRAARKAEADQVDAKIRQDRLITANEKLASAGRIEAGSSQAQTGIAHEALVTANRAWIAPADVSITSVGDVKLPDGRISHGNFSVNIAIINTGKTPAFQLTRNFSVKSLNVGLTNLGSQQTRAETGICNGIKKAYDSDIVYPSDHTGRQFHIDVNDPNRLPFMVYGCLFYSSLGVRHRTKFCEFTDLTDLGKPQKPVEQAVFRFCPFWNQAD